ncbi:MAG: ASCH domain-containing protein [Planctomycetota bacterium]|jgi:hypothetical protein
MIFKEPHYLDILDGTKTQTRRPVKPGEIAENSHGFTVIGVDGNRVHTHWNDQIETVRSLTGYPKFQRSSSRAVQAGRGGKTLYRIWIESIRRERLHDISPADLLAEGGYKSIDEFRAKWNEIYKHTSMKKYWWDKNPDVWVLTISPLETVFAQQKPDF